MKSPQRRTFFYFTCVHASETVCGSRRAFVAVVVAVGLCCAADRGRGEQAETFFCRLAVPRGARHALHHKLSRCVGFFFSLRSSIIKHGVVTISKKPILNFGKCTSLFPSTKKCFVSLVFKEEFDFEKGARGLTGNFATGA